MDVVVVREGKNVKGRVLAIVVGIVGKRVPRKGAGQDRQGHRSPELPGDRGESLTMNPAGNLVPPDGGVAMQG